MYNRYIPQPDGTYQRRRVEEPRQASPRPMPPPPPELPCESPKPETAPPCQPPSPCSHQKAPGFLRQLLPRDFDTGDLIVIVLLLLIAGDCEQERSNALLTLALYFIM